MQGSVRMAPARSHRPMFWICPQLWVTSLSDKAPSFFWQQRASSQQESSVQRINPNGVLSFILHLLVMSSTISLLFIFALLFISTSAQCSFTGNQVLFYPWVGPTADLRTCYEATSAPSAAVVSVPSHPLFFLCSRFDLFFRWVFSSPHVGHHCGIAEGCRALFVHRHCEKQRPTLQRASWHRSWVARTGFWFLCQWLGFPQRSLASALLLVLT